MSFESFSFEKDLMGRQAVMNLKYIWERRKIYFQNQYIIDRYFKLQYNESSLTRKYDWRAER